MGRKRNCTRRLMSGKLFLSVVLMCSILVSCIKDDSGRRASGEMREFLKKTECGLVGYGGYLFKYSDNNCQMSVNKRRRYMRMQNDAQSDYVHLVFAANPKVTDKNVQMELRYLVGSDENVRSATMVNVKSADGKIWLWNEDSGMGLIIPVL